MKTILRTGLLFVALFASTIHCGSSSTGDTQQEKDDVLALGDVPELGTRIDRMGRPETSNFLLKLPALKSEWNAEDSFDLSEEKSAKYGATITGALGHFDSFDGAKDMSDETRASLSEVLVDDQLRIDLSKDCRVDSKGYFEIEQGERFGKDWTSCGGRSPNEDVVDTLVTLFTQGPEKMEPRVGDQVDVGTGPAVDTFPYLAKPHLLRPRTPPP